MPAFVSLLAAVRARYPTYHAWPVPGLWGLRSFLVVVGLARDYKARMQRGGHSREIMLEHYFISSCLYLYLLTGRLRIPALAGSGKGLPDYECCVKCLPPGNKPFRSEISACNAYLQVELVLLQKERSLSP